jgi:hypothetical protein
MTPAKWPKGVDVVGRWRRWQARQCVPTLRSAIERLAAESPNVECYDAAAAAFLEQHELSLPMHPKRRVLDRLARLYVRHFRRELVREHQFLEIASRHALMAAAG